MRRKKAAKTIRYLRVVRKKTKVLTRKKVNLWINKNLKGHPFILGLTALVWLGYLCDAALEPRELHSAIIDTLRFHGILILSWLVLVIWSNLLRDTQRVKWFFKKRFVFLMLFVLFPFGVILLWSGSRFKKWTRVILTIVCALLFFSTTVYRQVRYQKLLHMPPFDRVVDKLFERKVSTFLKTTPDQILSRLRIVRIPSKQRAKLAVSDIYTRYARGVVAIMTKDKAGKEIGEGSGFLISSDGILVTNAHVVQSAYAAEARVAGKTFIDVSLVKVIPAFDMAVLKINAPGEFQPLAIGDSDLLVSGQVIVTLGNPLGLEQSVSTGIVSAVRSSPKLTLIQMTAPVSPGSSGGPVFNEYGEVVGITTIASFFIAQNLNFAVPINYLKKVTGQK